MKFLLDVEGSLKYTIFKEDNILEEFLISENVLIFDYDKGVNNTIHLIFLEKDGDLNYVTFRDGELIKSIIGKFDTKANSYNQISILLVKSKINVIYSYSNVINSNIYTLHHVVLSKVLEEKYTIIRYLSNKNNISFTVDCDSSGNIHLFYNTISNNFSFIYYTYFNPYSNRWLNNPIRLSNSEIYSEYPSIYVDDNDNVHGAWWETKSKDFLFRYNRMSSGGKEKFKWSEIKTPNIIQEKPTCNISQENSIIKITFDNCLLLSKDNGLNWIKEERAVVLDTPLEEILSSTNDLSKTEEVEKVNLEQLFINQMNLELMINNLKEEQLLLQERVINLEESMKNSKSSFRRFFS